MQSTKYISTATAVVKVVNDILNLIDEEKVAALVGDDISATFDMMSHELLLRRQKSEIRYLPRRISRDRFASRIKALYYSYRSVHLVQVYLKHRCPTGIGPLINLFHSRRAPIDRLITSFSRSFHKYADNT